MNHDQSGTGAGREQEHTGSPAMPFVVATIPMIELYRTYRTPVGRAVPIAMIAHVPDQSLDPRKLQMAIPNAGPQFIVAHAENDPFKDDVRILLHHADGRAVWGFGGKFDLIHEPDPRAGWGSLHGFPHQMFQNGIGGITERNRERYAAGMLIARLLKHQGDAEGTGQFALANDLAEAAATLRTLGDRI